MADGENGNTNGGGEADHEEKIELTVNGKIVVALLGIYLLVLLILSISWLGGLMFADTNDPENASLSLKDCIANKPAPTPTPDSANSSNANTNKNTSTTPNQNTSTNVSSASTPATNATNANRPANSNANGGDTAKPKSQNANDAAKSGDGKKNGNNNNGEEEAFNLRITRVIKIDKDGLFGIPISVASFTQSGCITADGYLFLVVLFAGMIGAIIRAVIYLTWRVGDKKFNVTWAWYYLFQPFLGAGMAMVVYVVIRGGFNGGAIGKGNVYAFAAVAFLTALFSDNAMAKLKLIAESLLVKVEPRHKTEGNKPAVGGGAGGTAAAKSGGAGAAQPAQPAGGATEGRTSGSMASNEPPV